MLKDVEATDRVMGTRVSFSFSSHNFFLIKILTIPLSLTSVYWEGRQITKYYLDDIDNGTR